jgi:hypothetical protein
MIKMTKLLDEKLKNIGLAVQNDEEQEATDNENEFDPTEGWIFFFQCFKKFLIFFSCT